MPTSTKGLVQDRAANTPISAATAERRATLVRLAGHQKPICPETKTRKAPRVTTPVNTSRLAVWLSDYDPQLKDTLVKGFSEGFSIPSTLESVPPSDYTNHRSALENPDIVSKKLNTELQLNRISGPFNHPPFHNFVSSPLGLVPKKSKGEFRLIHDLSFPKDSSVNSHINPSFTAVHYQDLDHCVSIITSLGKNCLMAKADLKDAFRIIPINSSDHRLLGFQWDGKFYHDRCLPMGCSVSCQLFETLSTAVQWILQTKLSVPFMSHILDDFIFFGPPSSKTCNTSLRTFFMLADSIKLPVKQSKTVFPTTCASLHGIEVDTEAMTMRLPLDKLLEARHKVNIMINRKKAPLVEFQSLIGTLNFACRVVVPGRAFLRRLIDLTKGVSNQSHWIKLTASARLDLRAWSHFLSVFNGRVMCLPNSFETSDVLKLYSDASGAAYAAVLGKKWMQGEFPQEWKTTNIAIKELLPIVLAVRLWGKDIANKRIMFFTDNLAIVSVINNQTSKEPSLMSLVRTLVLASLTNNILFLSKHIPGRHNVIADHLSRSQVHKAHELAPWLEAHPTPFPLEWLPW